MTIRTHGLRLTGVLLTLGLLLTLVPQTADAAPAALVSVEGTTTDENDTFVDVRIRLSSAVSHSTSVKFATSGGTALPGKDFYGVYRTVWFSPGETVKTVRIRMINDAIAEGDEAFNVRIFDVNNASGVELGTRRAKVQVRDDDRPANLPVVNVSGTTINEGGRFVDVRIRVGGLLTEAASVKFATSAGTAKPRSDFYGTYQTITFRPGQTVAVARIRLIDDRIPEPNEDFKVRIWDGQGVDIRTADAFVTINDND